MKQATTPPGMVKCTFNGQTVIVSRETADYALIAMTEKTFNFLCDVINGDQGGISTNKN